jgi:hypothetical protein
LSRTAAAAPIIIAGIAFDCPCCAAAKGWTNHREPIDSREFMKSNLLKNVLDWVLATGVILSIIFAVQFYFRTKDLRELDGVYRLQVAQFQQNRQVLGMLVNATAEYNKANPDANLKRILESFNPAPANVPAAAQKPAGK